MRRYVMALIAVAALSLAGYLLYRTLSGYEWSEIVAAVGAIPPFRLALAAACAAASYLCLTGFDYLGLHYVGRPLAYPKAALASFTALSLGHNIGLAALSSGAVRYRFYTRWGLGTEDVAKIILFCGVTVGLGLIVLGGVALLLQPDLGTEISGMGRPAVIAFGAGCLALALAYLAMAAFVRRPLRIRSWNFEMPTLPIAAGQIVIGTVNFAFVAGCLYQALAAVGEVGYPSVAAVYAIANATAIVSHVPGGLGVIESVVLLLLPGAPVFAALLVFRVVYYLVPLCLGGLTLAISELTLRGNSAGAPAAE